MGSHAKHQVTFPLPRGHHNQSTLCFYPSVTVPRVVSPRPDAATAALTRLRRNGGLLSRTPVLRRARSPTRNRIVPTCSASLLLSTGMVEALVNNDTFLRFAHACVCNVPIYILLRQWNQPMLTEEGLIHALGLGLLLWTTSGPAAYVVGFSFLLLGTAVTYMGKSRKEELGIAEGRGGRRGPENLWGAAGAAALCSVLAGLTRTAESRQAELMADMSSSAAFPWHFATLCLTMAFCGAIAAKSADTVSSEIGKAFGSRTYLLTTLQEVQRGTEGGVSLEGTAAGVVAAFATAVLAQGLGLLPNNFGLVGVTLAATIANLGESVIGANFQSTSHLTNEQINFFNTLIGATVAAIICYTTLFTG